MGLALTILILTYLLLALQRIPNIRLQFPAGSLLGALAIVASGVLPYEEALSFIPVELILFLLGMLIISVYLQAGNAVGYFAERALNVAVTPIRLVLFFLIAGAIISALTLNITAALILTPIALASAKRVNEKPTPYVIALILGVNLGSVATAIGSPQSMLIVSMSGMTFWEYTTKMTVLSAIGTLIAALWLVISGRRTMTGRSFKKTVVASVPQSPNFTGISALTVLIIVIASMLLGVPMPVAAMAGAAILLAINPQPPKDVLSLVNWQLITFVASLFVIVGGVGFSGIGDQAAAYFSSLSHYGQTIHLSGLALVVTTFTTVFSNLPSATLMAPILERIENSNTLWFTVALATTFAGNLSLFGSLSNLAVMEVTNDRGYTISFKEFIKVGVPVGLLTLIVGVLYIARV